MAQQLHRLKDLQVRKYTGTKALNDGGGLYLKPRAGGKYWTYRYKVDGSGREKGLGSYPDLTLEQARDEAATCRSLRRQGIDPIEHDRQQKAQAQQEALKSAAQSKTFQQCAEDFIQQKRHEWTNAKHEYQWSQSLEQNAYPKIGKLLIGDIDTKLVLSVLQPIWTTKTETATRVRQRMESILDYARAVGLREGENPARWKGVLEFILPKPSKVKQVEHHPAMKYSEIGDYYLSLTKGTVGQNALKFLMLTAVRSGEARAATWDEVDLEAKVWTIPASRMKARREFRVPLSDEAVEVLKAQLKVKTNDFLFSVVKGKHISDQALRKYLKEDHPDLTVHGFRSTFRDWCAEQTNYPREIAEAALAHILESKTEAAYQRGDLLEKRRQLMDAWAKHLKTASEQSGTVVNINRKQADG